MEGGLVMEPAQGFMDIVEEVGAGRNQAIDEAALEHIDHQPSHAGGDQRSGHPHHDHDPVAEHPLPDLVSGGQRTPLKGYPLHFLEQSRNALSTINDQRVGRPGKYLVFAHRLVLRALSRQGGSAVSTWPPWTADDRQGQKEIGQPIPDKAGRRGPPLPESSFKIESRARKQRTNEG